MNRPRSVSHPWAFSSQRKIDPLWRRRLMEARGLGWLPFVRRLSSMARFRVEYSADLADEIELALASEWLRQGWGPSPKVRASRAAPLLAMKGYFAQRTEQMFTYAFLSVDKGERGIGPRDYRRSTFWARLAVSHLRTLAKLMERIQ